MTLITDLLIIDFAFAASHLGLHCLLMPVRSIVLGFNDTSTLVGHFVSSPRENEKLEEIVEERKERDREE